MLNEIFRIAVIGGGPAGLMLAHLLQSDKNGQSSLTLPKIHITIFEADESSSSRTSQGGTLDLHPTTGLLAMRKAGLYDAFLEKARYDGTSLKVVDKHAKIWFNIPGGGDWKGNKDKGRPEIDRVELRRILLERLDQHENVTIIWGSKLASIKESSKSNKDDIYDSLFDLSFANGEKVPSFNFVIGADGAWSKTRSTYLDTTTKPDDATLTGYVFHILNAENEAPKEWKLVNKGSIFAFGDQKALIAQQLGNGSLAIASWVVATESSMHASATASKTKAEVLEIYQDWSENLQAFIANAAESRSEPRSLHSLPADYKWPHRPGVTLLGDAAHLMLPFAGEGVNLAFADAIKLSEAILTGLSTLSNKGFDDAIQSYEQNMYHRAQKAQRMTRRMTEAMLFTKEAPVGERSMERWMLATLEYEIEANWWKPLAWPFIVGVTYSLYSLFRLARRLGIMA